MAEFIIFNFKEHFSAVNLKFWYWKLEAFYINLTKGIVVIAITVNDLANISNMFQILWEQIQPETFFGKCDNGMGEGFFRVDVSTDRKVIKSRKNVEIFRTLNKVEPSATWFISLHPEMDNLVEQSLFMNNRPFLRAD